MTSRQLGIIVETLARCAGIYILMNKDRANMNNANKADALAISMKSRSYDLISGPAKDRAENDKVLGVQVVGEVVTLEAGT